uniref:Uncharacterized protein n=1 Tax=Oryzias latipes TaxID=8090 RepID=A0A3P9KKC1_ORYLA
MYACCFNFYYIEVLRYRLTWFFHLLSGCWRRRTQSGCWRRRTQSGCWRRRTQSGCWRRRTQYSSKLCVKSSFS